MTSISESRAIEMGWRIHQAVIAEGRREGVFAYLYHSPDGRAWFEKFDRKTKEVHRRFSPEVAAMIKGHVAELKVYARHQVKRDVADAVEDGCTPRVRFCRQNKGATPERPQ